MRHALSFSWSPAMPLQASDCCIQSVRRRQRPHRAVQLKSSMLRPDHKEALSLLLAFQVEVVLLDNAF